MTRDPNINMKSGKGKGSTEFRQIFRGVLSPGSTTSYTRAQSDVPKLHPFRIKELKCQFASYDVATANKQTFYPSGLQLRVPGSDDKTLYVGGPYICGDTSHRTVVLNCPASVYLDAGVPDSKLMFAVDSLCFAAGWEGGFAYIIEVTYQVRSQFVPEACSADVL